MVFAVYGESDLLDGARWGGCDTEDAEEYDGHFVYLWEEVLAGCVPEV